MAERLTPHPVACFAQPLHLADEAAVAKLPQTQIVCTSTLAFRDPDRMAPAVAAGRVWDVDTGHDLMITEPDAVAELLLRAAGSPPQNLVSNSREPTSLLGSREGTGGETAP